MLSVAQSAQLLRLHRQGLRFDAEIPDLCQHARHKLSPGRLVAHLQSRWDKVVRQQDAKDGESVLNTHAKAKEDKKTLAKDGASIPKKTHGGSVLSIGEDSSTGEDTISDRNGEDSTDDGEDTGSAIKKALNSIGALHSFGQAKTKGM